MIDTVGHYFTKPLVNKITQQPVEKITNKLEGILENIITHAGAKLFGNCAAEQERDKRINQDIERLKRQVEQAQNSQQKFILLQDEPQNPPLRQVEESKTSGQIQEAKEKTSGQIEESKTSGINKPGSVMIEHIGTASSAQVEGGGLKLVGEVQASSGAMAMAGGIDLSSLPLLEATGLAGLRAAGRAAPVVAGGVMAAKVINDTLEFQNQHPALYINPQEVISNPLLSKEQKHQLIEQFTNDPLISGRHHAPTGLFASHSYTKPDITWPDVVDFPEEYGHTTSEYSAIRMVKDQHKAALYSMAKSSMTMDKCVYKILPNQYKVQMFANIAEEIGENINRGLYPHPNAVGIIKHKIATEAYKEYSEVCKDYTFKTEVNFKDGSAMGNYDRSFIKGSTRADFVTSNIAQPATTNKDGNKITPQIITGPKEHYNLKFGNQDVLQVEYNQHLKNLPSGTEFYQVKPGEIAPRKAQDVLLEKKNKN